MRSGAFAKKFQDVTIAGLGSQCNSLAVLSQTSSLGRFLVQTCILVMPLGFVRLVLEQKWELIADDSAPGLFCSYFGWHSDGCRGGSMCENHQRAIVPARVRAPESDRLNGRTSGALRLTSTKQDICFKWDWRPFLFTLFWAKIRRVLTST